MTNEQFINTYKLMNEEIEISDKDRRLFCKSELDIQKIYQIIVKVLIKDFGNSIEIKNSAYKVCCDLVRFDNKHRINENTINNILKMYEERCSRKSIQTLSKIITDMDKKLPLEIDEDMFKIVNIQQGTYEIDGVKRSCKVIHNSRSKGVYIESGKGKDRIEFYACMLKDGVYKYYYVDRYDMSEILKIIVSYDYEKAYIANFLPIDIDIVDKALPKDMSIREYIKVLILLGLFKIGSDVKLKEFEIFRNTKKDMRGLINVLIPLKDISIGTKSKLLIKVEKLANDDAEIEKLKDRIGLFVNNIHLETGKLSEIISKPWDSIEDLMGLLKRICLNKVYSLTEGKGSNLDIRVHHRGNCYIEIYDGIKSVKRDIKKNVLISKNLIIVDRDDIREDEVELYI